MLSENQSKNRRKNDGTELRNSTESSESAPENSNLAESINDDSNNEFYNLNNESNDELNTESNSESNSELSTESSNELNNESNGEFNTKSNDENNNESNTESNDNSDEYRTHLLIYRVLLAAGLCLVLVAGYMIVSMFFGYFNDKKTYDEVAREYVTLNIPEQIYTEETDDKDQPESSETSGELYWYNMVDVRLNALMEAYPDVMGWIWFEDDSISYPILYSGDNEKYLSTAYNGKYAKAGSVFLDGDNHKSMFDPYIILYGHNMSDGSMFGSLKKFKNKDYYEDHKYFQIITDKYIIRYEIFAYSEISCYSDLYTIPLKQDVEFETKLAEILLASKLDSKELGVHDYTNELSDGKGIPSVNSRDFIVNLSTCTTHDERLFISAVQVDHYIIEK